MPSFSLFRHRRSPEQPSAEPAPSQLGSASPQRSFMHGSRVRSDLASSDPKISNYAAGDVAPSLMESSDFRSNTESPNMRSRNVASDDMESSYLAPSDGNPSNLASLDPIFTAPNSPATSSPFPVSRAASQDSEVKGWKDANPDTHVASRLADGTLDEKELDSASVAGMVLEETIPDGGWRAWLVVIGSFCGILLTFGVSNGTGTIEEYLLSHQLKGYSQSDVGWIFSLWLFIMYLGGVQTGPVFDAYGLRPLVLPGCVGWIASLFILSVSKKYYQFILGFSVLGGLSSSMIFNPSITVLGHWFRKRRSLVTGFSTAGGAVGGIYIPLMLNSLFGKIGYGWSIRVLAFINLGLAIIACATLESRHTKRKVDWREAIIDVKSLAIKDFGVCCLGVFLVEWAVFVPIIYMVTYARAQGLSPGYSNALLAYLNVGSVLGRAIPGYIADRIGTFNVMIVTNLVTGILCLALWIPGGHSKAGLTTFTVLFGFWSGSTISVTPVCVAAVSAIKDYGKRYGTAYSIASIAALTGLPIAGALTGHNFLGMKIFSGVVYLVGAVTFSISRWFAVGKQLKF